MLVPAVERIAPDVATRIPENLSPSRRDPRDRCRDRAVRIAGDASAATRLDEVVLPGTHNSMSAADRPGWFFANQVRPIPRRLRNGIRLLMIDPHDGVVDTRGRVRTDLRAEGIDRNRVARRLGTEAVHVAERLAAPPRAGALRGRPRDLPLPHPLRARAERMGATLNEIRGFFERNRSEVLVILVESSVQPGGWSERSRTPTLSRTWRRCRGTNRFRAAHTDSSGRRLMVLDEREGATGRGTSRRSSSSRTPASTRC